MRVAEGQRGKTKALIASYRSTLDSLWAQLIWIIFRLAVVALHVTATCHRGQFLGMPVKVQFDSVGSITKPTTTTTKITATIMSKYNVQKKDQICTFWKLINIIIFLSFLNIIKFKFASTSFWIYRIQFVKDIFYNLLTLKCGNNKYNKIVNIIIFLSFLSANRF